MRLLDVGVGDGYTIRLVKPDGEITGIDFDKAELAGAEARGISGKEGSAYDIPFPARSFEIVTCFEVLEHLKAPVDALKEIDRVLRPGGHLVVSTPVPNLRWSWPGGRGRSWALGKGGRRSPTFLTCTWGTNQARMGV